MKITQKMSPNFYDLDVFPPEYIVLHATLGNLQSVINTFMNPSTEVSAHFVVDRWQEEVLQMVELNKGAWHAGRIKDPTERAQKVLTTNLLGKYHNPNKRSLGIEFCAGYDIDRDGVIEGWEKLFSPQQIKHGAELILYIEDKVGRTYDDDHIITHRDITSYKPDIDLPRLMILSELKKRRQEAPAPSPTPEPTPEPEEEVESREDVKKEIIRLVNKL